MSVPRQDSETLQIRLYIADPLMVIILPVAGFPIVVMGLGVVAAFSTVFSGKVPPAQTVGLGLVLLVVLVLTVYAVLMMSGTTYRFDRFADRVTARRGPIELRSFVLSELERVDVETQSDDEGTTARARFVFRDGSETFVNSIFTGSTGAIERFAERVNHFLKEPIRD